MVGPHVAHMMRYGIVAGRHIGDVMAEHIIDYQRLHLGAVN